MPIEVKELVMRFNVGEETNRKPSKDNGLSPVRKATGDMELIVATCVEQVLDIIERAQDR